MKINQRINQKPLSLEKKSGNELGQTSEKNPKKEKSNNSKVRKLGILKGKASFKISEDFKMNMEEFLDL
ncbi:hypothetical protein [Leptospira sarikeiensis]|uniref:Uncharacterized protein n=1 Tax=Leptospira sarikeiensis TaxID=2484943 RepID=A0A4R9KFC7_9LEPT|nr:hypothetical protein [Leptospira sarikeiensis]TGL65782.1 hypothetical protein EHQ64_00465 [Leptospira sarikeiensis]